MSDVKEVTQAGAATLASPAENEQVTGRISSSCASNKNRANQQSTRIMPATSIWPGCDRTAVGEHALWDKLKAVNETFTVNLERNFRPRNIKAHEVEIFVAPLRAATKRPQGEEKR